jgi:hypothetical protein
MRLVFLWILSFLLVTHLTILWFTRPFGWFLYQQVNMFCVLVLALIDTSSFLVIGGTNKRHQGSFPIMFLGSPLWVLRMIISGRLLTPLLPRTHLFVMRQIDIPYRTFLIDWISSLLGLCHQVYAVETGVRGLQESGVWTISFFISLLDSIWLLALSFPASLETLNRFHLTMATTCPFINSGNEKLGSFVWLVFRFI